MYKLVVISSSYYYFQRDSYSEDEPTFIFLDAINQDQCYKEWRLEGKLHRTTGPAVIGADGHTEWWVGGSLHRQGGPAIEYDDGHKEWWFNGRRRILHQCGAIT